MKQTRALLWLTFTSIVLSFTILLVTILVNFDVGMTSLFLAPTAAFLTIVYHTTVLLIARHRAAHAATTAAGATSGTITTRRSPATTKWSIGLAWVLCLLWAAALAVTIVFSEVSLTDAEEDGGHSDKLRLIEVAVPALVFELGQLGVMIALAIVAMRARRHEPYGVEWYQL